jgi:hypothetical protein
MYRFDVTMSMPEPPFGVNPGRDSLRAVTFRPDAIRGAGTQGAGGTIEYRLARMAVVSEYRKGRLARHEVCDAHPELRRAAAQASEPTSMECPICEDDHVVLVTYAFGSGLPAFGRCITAKGELQKLAKGRAQVACYVVEVCPTCSWNHLAQTFFVGQG